MAFCRCCGSWRNWRFCGWMPAAAWRCWKRSAPASTSWPRPWKPTS
ncbi:hypothetical protein HML84_16820 [Alcanivorax sp. IO_7]|nr:hypothetical protein HML84_16820 [Alcanivorax sp. IO_7]